MVWCSCHWPSRFMDGFYLMSNFNYKLVTPKTEFMNGAFYNFVGNILPDFGFPDKQMNRILSETWPNDNWDRGQVYDLYKWYQTGIKSGTPPYDVDTNNKDIYYWIKDNSPYPDSKVTHFMTVFRIGVLDNWIEPHYVGQGLAPEHEGTKLAETMAWLPRGITNLKWLLLAGTGLIVAFYGMPIVAGTYKATRKK